MSTLDAITELLGPDAKGLLEHKSNGHPQGQPAPAWPRLTWIACMRGRIGRPRSSDGFSSSSTRGVSRGPATSRSFPSTRVSSISAGASFAKNPAYFDPENIVKLAIEGGCNAVASTLGVLGSVARKYAHKIPFIMKFNHNEFLTYPNKFDQIFFARVEQAADMGAVAVGATIYFGSDEAGRQIVEVGEAFQAAHEMGMATILWCYLRNPAFKTKDKDYHVSADLTGQANHLGVTLQADIIKQKLPENNGGYKAISSKENPYGKIDDRVYTELCTDHTDRPDPLPGGQLLHGALRSHQFRGRVGPERLRGRGEDRGHQQARGGDGPHLRPQGLPASDGRGCQAAEHDPGRLSLQGDHDRLKRGRAARLTRAQGPLPCGRRGTGRYVPTRAPKRGSSRSRSRRGSIFARATV
jgi:class I fructose-bisphosphate aldolase